MSCKLFWLVGTRIAYTYCGDTGRLVQLAAKKKKPGVRGRGARDMEVIGGLFLGAFSLVIGIVMGAGVLQLTFRALHNMKDRELLKSKAVTE